MANDRVLLISRNLLFSSGIQSLLTRQANVEIVGQEADPTRAIERVKELQPDVVLMDSDSPADDPAELALAIFRAGMRVRVIELGLKDNAIHIYRKERRIAHGVEDLMRAMENDLVPDLVSPAESSALATARGRLYGFLGAVYNRLPDEQFASSLASGELSNLLATVGEMEDLTADAREGLELIQQYIRQVKGKPVEEMKTELAVERTRLVRGLTPALSPLPPYESEYVGGGEHRMAASMQVAREYAAAGVALPEEVRERPDFIGFELDFMRHLCEQEAQAWSEQDRPGALALMQKERAFICIGLAGLAVILDLGSPQRVYQLITNPQWGSPLMWDVVIISFYLVLSAVYLWVHAKAEGGGPGAAQFQTWVHTLAYLALPAAVLVHSITAWIFGLQVARSYWHSALLAPFFISSALVSGLGLFLLAILLARKVQVVKASDQLVSWLGGLLAVFILVDLFFLLAELLTRLYPAAEAEAASAQLLLTGRNAPLFWAEVGLGLVLPFVLLAFKRWRTSIPLVGLSALLAIVGIFLKRWNILTAGFAYPLDAFPDGTTVAQVLPWTRLDPVAQWTWVPSGALQLSLPYSPTMVEIAIVVGLLAAGALVWLLGLQLLPLHVKAEEEA